MTYDNGINGINEYKALVVIGLPFTDERPLGVMRPFVAQRLKTAREAWQLAWQQARRFKSMTDARCKIEAQVIGYGQCLAGQNGLQKLWKSVSVQDGENEVGLL